MPVVCTVIGEGGSGGALAIAVGDALLMLQFATYFGHLAGGLRVHTLEVGRTGPGGSRVAGHHGDAAQGPGPDRQDRPGTAGRRPSRSREDVRLEGKTLTETLKPLAAMPIEELLVSRRRRLLSFGKFKEIALN